MSDLITVDDLAFDEITYIDVDDNNFWNPFFPPNDPNVRQGEVRMGASTGLSATFTFTGSQVSVFGRVQPALNGSQQPLSLYSVGSQHLQAFVAPDVTTAQDNVAFFNSSVMPYNQYTLIINVSRASASAPYFLDYIQYNTSNPDAGPTSAPSSTSTTSSTSSTGSGTPLSGSSGSSSLSAPVGAIVGGVVGGIAVIAAAVFAFVWYRLRERSTRKHAGASDEGKFSPPSGITPYIVPSLAHSQGRFADFDEPPNALGPSGSIFVGQHGSSHSLGYHGESGRPNKAALARALYQSSPSPGSLSTYRDDSAQDATWGAQSVSGTGTGSGSEGHQAQSVLSRSAHTPSPRSTVPDLPNPANPPAHSGTRAKGARFEPWGPRPPGSRPATPTSPGPPPVQEDSGVRFQPGLTPSNVAPVLPPGVIPGPIRSAATGSEVARADIPPAYTSD
ncbi:hypothetical protein BD309DRAFT_966666 [Dichomitus squalens]|uniref:Uncharacterized protein n=1 Tax=Dichomitus squalens TaxID=114155 RepID=A0A4Q9NHS5_9APHY|nr:hypothetical protein BD309DRAFT_966666 [Dichomitus squalens]TBU59599.1 hypothetical protein BD310DRAFT_384234 [Dichomitus squalens]